MRNLLPDSLRQPRLIQVVLDYGDDAQRFQTRTEVQHVRVVVVDEVLI